MDKGQLRPSVKIAGSNRMRKGRGFSLGELKEAGLSLEKAKAMNIPVDKRRKSVHKENVELLKKFLS